MDIKKKELGIYIHIPFCVSKCIYCDFLSMPVNDETKALYVNSLCEEIKEFAASHRDEYIVSTVFLGGGTPSSLKPFLTEQIFNCLRECFVFEEDCEITVECNPGTVDLFKLTTYKNIGVNRLSFGMQSVNDEELKALGRIHTYKDFLKSYEIALKAGFDNINVDLMSALPGQTVESWRKTLREITRLKTSHISAYSLILEEGTTMYNLVENGIITNLPDEDTEREIYFITKEILEKAGYHRYEISNYSRDGRECKHNKIYWQGGDYIGFGLGAASYIGRKRFSNIKDLSKYIDKPLSDKEDITLLSEEDMMAEFMYLGLRMMEGVKPSDFKNRFGRHLMNVYGDVINKYVGTGHMETGENYVRLTTRGIDVSNVIFSDFLL